jgi:hypothetical protein
MKTGRNLWLGAIALVIVAFAIQTAWWQFSRTPSQTRPIDEGLDPSLKLPPPVYVSPDDE